MPKKQISLRISTATAEKLARLAVHYGTQAEAIAVAIDRLDQAENSDHARLKRGDTDIPCANCGADVDPHSSWQPGIYGEAFCHKCA